MSALPQPEVIRVERLEDGLRDWPPSSLGWAAPVPDTRWHDSGHRPMQPRDFDEWTEAGRDALVRILRKTLRANGRLT